MIAILFQGASNEKICSQDWTASPRKANLPAEIALESVNGPVEAKNKPK
jgi:hypothetical protein